MKNIICVLILLSTILLQGCIVAGIGAGVAAVKWANAKKKEAAMTCNKDYNNYMSLMIKTHQNPISMKEYCDKENN